mmetsp:Transcript_74591/g.189285  ORF Transcript_74591/g.189285 Transcript_74591/m.189285 type:complete len:229 (+) Transcript_74591:314-1000(+)
MQRLSQEASEERGAEWFDSGNRLCLHSDDSRRGLVVYAGRRGCLDSNDGRCVRLVAAGVRLVHAPGSDNRLRREVGVVGAAVRFVWLARIRDPLVACPAGRELGFALYLGRQLGWLRRGNFLLTGEVNHRGRRRWRHVEVVVALSLRFRGGRKRRRHRGRRRRRKRRRRPGAAPPRPDAEQLPHVHVLFEDLLLARARLGAPPLLERRGGAFPAAAAVPAAARIGGRA